MKRCYALLLLFFPIVVFSQELSNHIHVDQFGYTPEAIKVGVLSDPQIGYNSAMSYTAPTTIEVRDAVTDATVLSINPVLWNNGNTHAQSGDRGWWVDFSLLTEEGSYYLYDATINERSAVFTIGVGVYDDVMKSAGRMFYYNRCNAPKSEPYAQGWTDGDNFLQDTQTRYIYDQGNVALEKELSGGWFDAGDYNKYVTFASDAVHDLLAAYEENPQAFSDDWNIPESGNGIPDVLDEVKWELDWLLKMNQEDGSTIIKMGSRNFEENIESPPSLNVDTRYYGPTCTSASIAVAGMFAHASKVFSGVAGYDDFATLLQERSIASYAYAQPFVENGTLETNCDDGSIIAGDADRDVEAQEEEFVVASAYLFDLTGNTLYSDYVVSKVPDLQTVNSPFWGPYKIQVHDALLLYANTAGADTATITTILDSFSSDAQNNFNGYYGMSDEDLYRAFQPDFSYHWGSNNPKASYATVNKLVIDSNINPSQNESYRGYIEEVIHYFHGVNPQGMVYLSNMYDFGAERSVNEIYHSWFYDGTDYDNAVTSPIGPAPGFVTGGPNDSFSVTTLTPPAGQPAQKSYLDFNDGYPNSSWEISEPAIYYQAAYIRMLANSVQVDDVLATETNELKPLEVSIYPNPTTNTFRIEGVAQNSQLEIYSVLGQFMSSERITENSIIDVSNFSKGIYFVKLRQDNTISTQKLIVN
ncbi:glycoside hydrolase family 9 protein [uncultured Dokdonia sp.]|uniref:glycoside hydrolase family 9 protein n=1 Tax=uncultured Dokdonia sp. TaxID=575653 RepID=UPI00260D4684|nr:glycoside hydrolase family 9 protein [uncultured Dokdonia sp.]